MANIFEYLIDPDQQLGNRVISYRLRKFNASDVNIEGVPYKENTSLDVTYITLCTNGQWVEWQTLRETDIRVEFQEQSGSFDPKTKAEKMVGLLLGLVYD